MKFEIKSFMSAGPVQFGMSREQVRTAIGGKYDTFKRTGNDDTDTDDFSKLGVQVEYDADGNCIAVIMSAPSDPVFRERRVLHGSYAETKKWLLSLDEDSEVEEDGTTSYELGIGIYADIKPGDKKAPTEAVIAFSKGYYDL